VSDDSDIEGHPNVDHKSLVKWKQRDIHEKRYARNMKIAQLEADISCNSILLPKLKSIAEEVKAGGPPVFSRIVEKLRTQPSKDKPPGAPDDAPTYDGMLCTLLMNVFEELKKDGIGAGDERLGPKLVEQLEGHVVGLSEAITNKKEELAVEEAEKKKKITSEDIHEGFETTVCPYLFHLETLINLAIIVCTTQT
jgi:cell division cycle protein 37